MNGDHVSLTEREMLYRLELLERAVRDLRILIVLLSIGVTAQAMDGVTRMFGW